MPCDLVNNLKMLGYRKLMNWLMKSSLSVKYLTTIHGLRHYDNSQKGIGTLIY